MQTIKQTIIILIASAIVIVGGLWLAQTEWAEGVRQNQPEAGQLEEGELNEEDRENMPSSMVYVGSFIKELVLMGIPGLITLGVLKASQVISSRQASQKKSQTGSSVKT